MDYYKILDILLHIAHSGLVLFMVFGIFYKPWAKWHFIAVIMIWISWLLVGSYVGTYGYCPLTEMQWNVKRHLGEYSLPPSYIEYVYTTATGQDVDNKLMSNIIAAVMLVITMVSFFRFFMFRKTSA